MEALRILGISVGAAALALLVSLVVGTSLLEIPYSLPFAVCISIILALLGVPRPAGLQGASWLVAEVPPDGRPPPDVGAFVYGPSAEPDDDALRALGYVE